MRLTEQRTIIARGARGSGSSLVASADYHSPINTGVMLLRPSERMYQLGLRVLRRNDFDPTLGFDRAGRPSEALAALRAHATPQLWREVAATRMLWQDRWTFVGGHACQGLFVHVFLVLPWSGKALTADAADVGNGPERPRQAPLWFHYPRNISERREDGLGTHHVHHFRAQGKVRSCGLKVHQRAPESTASPSNAAFAR